MSAEVELISTMVEKKAWTRPPIQMEFQVLQKNIHAVCNEEIIGEIEWSKKGIISVGTHVHSIGIMCKVLEGTAKCIVLCTEHFSLFI